MHIPSRDERVERVLTEQQRWLGGTSYQVLTCIANAADSISTPKIVELTGIDRKHLGVTLLRLERKGLILKTRRGVWVFNTAPSH